MLFCKRIWAFFLMFLVIFAPNILCGYAEAETELFNMDFDGLPIGEITEKPAYLSVFSKSGNSKLQLFRKNSRFVF